MSKPSVSPSSALASTLKPKEIILYVTASGEMAVKFSDQKERDNFLHSSLGSFRPIAENPRLSNGFYKTYAGQDNIFFIDPQWVTKSRNGGVVLGIPAAGADRAFAEKLGIKLLDLDGWPTADSFKEPHAVIPEAGGIHFDPAKFPYAEMAARRSVSLTLNADKSRGIPRA